MMRRRLLINKLENGGGEMNQREVGDVVLVDKSTEEKLFVSPDDLEKYPASDYVPIAVVVIPSDHDVYGTGECGVIALNYINPNSPDLGGEANSVLFAISYTDLGIKEFRNKINWISNTYSEEGPALNNVQRASDPAKNLTNNLILLPSDKFSTVNSGHDKLASYAESSFSIGAVPSPFLTDGSRNPSFSQTESPSNENNALAYFNGKEKTEEVAGLIKAKGWYTTYYFPAVVLSQSYQTEGTEKGDWFMPSIAELCYFFSRISLINESFRKINSVYPDKAVEEVGLKEINYFLTASFTKEQYLFRIGTENGLIIESRMNNTGLLRAFTKLKRNNE